MINLNDADRREYGRKLGKVVKVVGLHYLGVEADIYFNKDTMIFSARLNGEFFQSKNGIDVENWLIEQLKAANNLDWIPVICVLDTEHGSYRYNNRDLELHQIAIDVSRFYVAALPDGTIRAVDWDTPKSKRNQHQSTAHTWPSRTDKAVMVDGKIKLPANDEQTYILAYTEELWVGLNELMVSIDKLRNKLHQMLKSDDGIKKIATVGQSMMKLLTDGAK
jgi:hypothetical protein